MRCAVGESFTKMFEKSTVKLTLTTNLNIFDNLKEKSDYFSGLAFEQVNKECQRRIDKYNKSSWFSKFWDKKTVIDDIYTNKKYSRLSSSDYWTNYDELNGPRLKGVRNLYKSEFLLRINKTITFCRENDIGSIEMEDDDAKLLDEIEKKYSKK